MPGVDAELLAAENAGDLEVEADAEGLQEIKPLFVGGRKAAPG